MIITYRTIKGQVIIMKRVKDTSQRVWIKRYLAVALGLSKQRLYRHLKGDYSAVALQRYLAKNGYQTPADKRTKAGRTAKPDTSPSDRPPVAPLSTPRPSPGPDDTTTRYQAYKRKVFAELEQKQAPTLLANDSDPSWPNDEDEPF